MDNEVRNYVPEKIDSRFSDTTGGFSLSNYKNVK